MWKRHHQKLHHQLNKTVQIDIAILAWKLNAGSAVFEHAHLDPFDLGFYGSGNRTIVGPVFRSSIVLCNYKVQMLRTPVRHPSSALFETTIDPDRLRRNYPQVVTMHTGLTYSWNIFLIFGNAWAWNKLSTCSDGHLKLKVKRRLNCDQFSDPACLSVLRAALAEKSGLSTINNINEH